MPDEFPESPLPGDRLDGSFIVVARGPTKNSVQFRPGAAPPPAATVGLNLSPHPSLSGDYIPGSAERSYAHNWDPSLEGNKLSINRKHLVDSWGRVCLPRGVNLSGSSKFPTNHDPTTFPAQHTTVTFVGRPFSLAEAPEHFARLRRWGLTFVRFLITWEAIEHAGPGRRDEEYLDYLQELLKMMTDFGIVCVVSMHQDVWCRFSGGSGAPAWTLEAVGFDLHKLEVTGAAYLGGVRAPGTEHVKGRWPTGYLKLASCTMWTCFWAGDIFAPKLKTKNDKGELFSIQAFLQSAFLDMFAHLSHRLGALPAVLGFECLNEPHTGYINLPSLHQFNYFTELHFHDTPSALQSFALGTGHKTKIPHYARSFPYPTKRTHEVECNAVEASVWRTEGPTGGRCVWEMHGVWAWDTFKAKPIALRESYFTQNHLTGKNVDWYQDCWYPFIMRWASVVHGNTTCDKLLFVEPTPNELCPSSWTAQHRPKNMVFAPHWYDLNSLFTKSFGSMSVNVQGLSRGMSLMRAIYWGHKGARANYQLQISTIVGTAHSSLSENVPVIIGECGVPMDMNQGEAFRTGNFIWQERAMDALMYALERTMVGFTLWNYNPDNTDEEGDFWNGENFSWFSQSRARQTGKDSLEQDDASLDVGGRLLFQIVRPYPAKVAGIPLSFEYESGTGEFMFRFKNIGPIGGKRLGTGHVVPESPPPTQIRSRETEIFVPVSLAHSREMNVSGLGADDKFSYDERRQTLFIVHHDQTADAVHTVRVSFNPPLSANHSSHGSFFYVAVIIATLSLYIGYVIRY